MDAIFYADIQRLIGVLLDPRFIREELGVPPRNPGETVSYWQTDDLPIITTNLILYLGNIMAMHNVGYIKDATGVGITGEFIADTLGIPPAERDKRAMLWTDDQIPKIFAALGKHFTQMSKGPLPAPKPKAAKSEATTKTPPADTADDLFEDSADDLFE